ncbi:oligogalacturonate lyase family protein [Mangrovibacterium diazotrophicum]|uniref:Type IV secretion system putative lipoprotein virB7 n=1 Tax=Mangrovibacterium diazotrophicum TaxID=1261403 RepID=A0A419WAW4_9BACT|nr:oligogalacturonate lyase family protein [Mangrovibacterium diazotrophicum]RKD92615.1 oligogalacturonide lyase [Mangrovibacterium diazotrophicum]
MKKYELFFLLIVLFLSACQNKELLVIETGSQTPMPESWIDQDTGHKITHLVDREGDNRSFYFHNNPFLPATAEVNEKMIFSGKVGDNSQLFAVDLKTKQAEQLTNKKGVSGEVLGTKTRSVYYQCGDSVFVTGVERKETRLIYVFPDSLRGHITTVNADETLLGGAISSPEEREIFRNNPKKSDYFNLIYEAKLERSLFTIDVETGELKKIFSDHAWLNHIQFSPIEPNLLMFCHEGPWHKVDRIWTIDITGGEPKLMHKRSMDMEIAGHEFFSPDGKRIWFDLQMPRSKTFFLSGADVETGDEKRYSLTRNEWSIHYTISPDQSLFAGDGGDPGQVAKAEDGMWIYLFYPEGDHFRSEKLVNMKHHDYKLEPNVHFSPDGKQVIFRANFEGHSDIYAVDLTK